MISAIALAKSEIEEIEDWRNQSLKKSKIEEIKKFKKSKLKKVKDWRSWSLETQPEFATQVESTNVGMPFGYPWISIPSPAHYGGGQVQGLDKMTWRRRNANLICIWLYTCKS
jgi:hypothetical protein